MRTATSEAGELDRAYLQRRVALLCAVLLIINAIGVATQLLPDPLRGLTRTPTHLMLFMGLSVTLVLVAMRRIGALATWAIEWIEASLLLSMSVVTALIAHAIPAELSDALLHPEAATGIEASIAAYGPLGFTMTMRMSCIVGLTQTFVLRAALVPSTQRRTLVLTVLGGAVMGVLFVVPIPGWEADVAVMEALPEGASVATLFSVGVWWTMTTLICVVMSRVVHGLRRQVRHARRLGQYQLEAMIGEGGMGVVYRAKHALLRRETAIKLILPERAGSKTLARFEREVRLTATLSHPNTVTIFDYGRTPDDVFYYAMELLDGAALDRMVEIGGPMPASRAVYVLKAVAGALAEAHDKGLVHRDIKPGNIMLARLGGMVDVPKLLDFGLVKDLETGDPALTDESTITGTPHYLAPEVIRTARSASPASDVYALGAVGYFLVTGTHVFEGHNVVEICSHHLHSPPEPPSERLGGQVPEALEELILECLAKEPAQRPKSGRGLLRRLEALEGVVEWTDTDRTHWWNEHEVDLEPVPDASSLSDRATLHIDLVRRIRSHARSHRG